MAATQTAQAQSASSPRAKCTAIRGYIDATAAHVCVAAGFAALHVHSLTGTTIVRMRWEDFAEACRGTRDANGNPFPARARAMLDLIEADAAATAPSGAPSVPAPVIAFEPIAPVLPPKIETSAPAEPAPAAATVPAAAGAAKESEFAASDARLFRAVGVMLTRTRVAALREAWGRHVTEGVKASRLAADMDCSPVVVSRAFKFFRSQPGAPVFKPNGTL